MKETKEFEILVIDEGRKSPIVTEHQLAYSLLSNSLISVDGVLDKSKNEVSFAGIKILISKISADNLQTDVGNSFLLKAIGPFNEIEPLREKLVAHISDRGFRPIYILVDQASEQIACALYPFLYRVENSMRSYIIKFMSTRIGQSGGRLLLHASGLEN